MPRKIPHNSFGEINTEQLKNHLPAKDLRLLNNIELLKNKKFRWLEKKLKKTVTEKTNPKSNLARMKDAGAATITGFIITLAGLFFAELGIVSLVLAIVGFILCLLGLQSEWKWLAWLGFVLSMISLNFQIYLFVSPI